MNVRISVIYINGTRSIPKKEKKKKFPNKNGWKKRKKKVRSKYVNKHKWIFIAWPKQRSAMKAESIFQCIKINLFYGQLHNAMVISHSLMNNTRNYFFSPFCLVRSIVQRLQLRYIYYE